MTPGRKVGKSGDTREYAFPRGSVGTKICGMGKLIGSVDDGAGFLFRISITVHGMESLFYL